MGENFSIYDVAKKAGVSIATVSRVINGSDKVKDSKKEAVENAIRELNYVPSESARRLAGNRSGMIGVALPFDSLEGSYIVEFLKGAVRRLDETVYSIVLINDHNYGREDRDPVFMNYIQKRSIDALLFSVVAPGYKKEWLEKVVVKNLPIAYVGEPFKEFREYKNIFSVNNNRENLLYDAVKHFYKCGHKDVGMFIFEGEQHKTFLDRAVLRFEKEYGNSIRLHLVEVKIESLDIVSNDTLDEMIDVINENKCTAVFSISTSLSKTFLNRFQGNISMLSIQWENDGSNDVSYNVDSINISVNDLGYYGMDMLVKCIENQSDLKNHISLDYKIELSKG